MASGWVGADGTSPPSPGSSDDPVDDSRRIADPAADRSVGSRPIAA